MRSSFLSGCSEPDKGIYDAMNKGLKKATGDYVWFLNAGDEIYSPDTLNYMNSIEGDADAFYGEVEYVDEVRKKSWHKNTQKAS